ncbi:MAG: iron-containing alcohol dehydrogenase [Kofleriaceae bacterium]
MPAPDLPGSDPIELLLSGRYPDPETGALLEAASRSVVIEATLDGREVDLVAALDLGTRFAVISDVNTHAVLGQRVERALRSRFAVQSLVLDHSTRAEPATIQRVLGALDPHTDAVIAVGSGTLNDLSKMVALQRGCPQLVFATAPSMNGYTSLSASITVGGLKRSIRAATPVGVFVDLAVVAKAPPRLIHAGLGDSLCRSTAQADWLLAHLVLDRPYREAPYALLADDERALIERSQALVAGDLEAMRHLVRTLVLSGFGMTICGGSYPASQGEHLISHYLDMMRPAALPVAFHGEQVAVATVAMATLQDRILALDALVLRPTTNTRADVEAHFGPVQGAACWQELAQKLLDRDATDAVNDRLARTWDNIRDRIAGITLGAQRLTQVLAAVGAPTSPADLGWPAELFAGAVSHARELRNRYTFLDLAADLG